MRNTNTTPDEIDLMSLLFGVFDSIRKNWWLAILLPLVGGIIGFWLTHSSTGLQGRMMIKTEVLNLTESTFILEELKHSDSLHKMEPAVINVLQTMTSEVVKVIGNAENNNEVYITITANSGDAVSFSKAQAVIIAALNSSDAYRLGKKRMSNYYNEMITAIETELNQLNKAKSNMDFTSKNVLINSGEVFKEAVQLTEQKIIFQNKLAEIQSVTVVSGFNPHEVVIESFSYRKTFIGIILGTIIFVVILLLKSFFIQYNQYRISRST